MELVIAIMALLIVVVFGFVLEPIIRARRDRVQVDTAIVPDLPDFVAMTQGDAACEEESAEEPAGRSTIVEPGRVEGSS